jgi:proteasome assembly chaperone 2
MFRPQNGTTPDLKGSVLVLPALSLGNVGQLAIDAMIVTLDAEKVGYLEDEAVIPVIGNDVFTRLGSGVVATAMEVYYRKGGEGEKSMTIVQQRSPVAKGQNKRLSKLILEFAQQQGFESIILLLSSDATRRVDSQLNGIQIRYISEEKSSLDPSSPGYSSNDAAKQLIHRLNELSIPSLESDTIEVTLKQGTFASSLLSQSSQNSSSQSSSSSSHVACNPPIVILTHFVHEGYNFPEALSLASSLCQLLKITLPTSSIPSLDGTTTSQVAWVLPSSWRFAIRSPPPDQRLY